MDFINIFRGKSKKGQPGVESPDSSTSNGEGVKFAKTRLKSQEERHLAEMKRIDEDHEKQMRSMENEWKSTVGQATSALPSFANFEHDVMMGKTESYRIGKDPAGYCLFISNSDAHKESVDALALNFVKLGFHVSLHENISGNGMWNLLQDTARKRLEEYECFVCFIAGKGTPRSIEGKDGRKIDWKKIISLFDPSRIPSLCARPKLMLFQCDVSAHFATNIWANEENPAFAPPYQDALTLFSTHRNFVKEFLRSLEDNRKQNLEQILDATTKKIAPTSDDIQSVVIVSTLQKDVYLHGRKEYR